MNKEKKNLNLNLDIIDPKIKNFNYKANQMNKKLNDKQNYDIIKNYSKDLTINYINYSQDIIKNILNIFKEKEYQKEIFHIIY